MAAYLLRRLAASLLLVFLVLSLTFAVIHLAPGDPARILAGPRIPLEHAEALRRAYGLDRPLPERYAAWLSAVALEFDWGVSFTFNEPVTSVVRRHLPNTLWLASAALAVQFVAGLWMGVGAARRAGSAGDHAVRIASLGLYATPTFWLGVMALLLLTHVWPLFPPGQMRSLGAESLSAPARALDFLYHLALPALVLGLSAAGATARFVRASLLEVLDQEYIRTARAKGLTEGRVLWVHALRNSLAPLLQLLGLSLPFLLSGALVVEVVFSWPGMGRMTYGAILARDYPLILAATALTAALVVAGSLLADLLQAAVDPRVRLHD